VAKLTPTNTGRPEEQLFRDAESWTNLDSRLTIDSYSRVTAYNSSVLLLEQIANENGTVVAELLITHDDRDSSVK